MPDQPLKPDVYVVIAAYNEQPVIGQVLGELSAYLPARRVIVVDDASADETAQEARRAGATVLRHAINRGQGAALATGIAAALRLGAQIIVTFDADGQHDPADLPRMIEPVASGEADIVLGTRFGDRPSNVPPLRKLLLKAGVWMTRAISRVPVSDMHNGFRAMSRRAAQLIRIRRDRMEHSSEIIDEIRRHRLHFVECPVSIRYTAYSMRKGQKNRDALGMAARILFYKAGG